MSIEYDIKSNFKDFKASGDDELSKGRYNPAVVSYFKAIAVLCDLKIYMARGLLPKYHKERFLFLNVHFPEIAQILSGLFKKYTDSYNLRMSKTDAMEMQENVKKTEALFETGKSL